MADLLSNGLHEKGNDMLYYYFTLLKVDYLYSLLRNSLGNGHWSTNKRRGAWLKLIMVFTLNFTLIC